MSPKQDTPIFLVLANASSRRVRRRILGRGHPRGRPVPWLYLGRDYLKMRAWEAMLGKEFERVQYGKRLQELGNKWRRPYLDWITALGKSCAGLVWWSSRLAERNTQLYSLFHDLCYLEIGVAFGSSSNSPLLIIVESKLLLYTLSRQPELRGCIQLVNYVFLPGVWVAWVVRLILVWIRYVLKGYLELRDARKSRRGGTPLPLRSQKRRVLIHSCIDETYFGVDGKGHDRYFTVLPDELRKRDFDVVIIPWLSNLKRPRREAFLWFRRSPESYLIPEDFYTLADYMWAASIVIKQAWLLGRRQTFEGRDITLLAKDALRRGAVATDAARFVRYIRLIRKLRKIEFKVDIYIDKFENMITEKPQLLAFRAYMPEVLTVGFQHYVAPHPLLLNMFTTPEEVVDAPYPDAIVCNSAFVADLLAKEGFPPEKLKVGPSLRYLHLLDGPRAVAGEDRTVLVMLALHPAVSAEMMHKLVEAFPKDEGIRFLIKVHPMMTDQQRRLVMGERDLPHHMRIVDGEIAQWIKEAACAIVGGGTSGLELLLAGVPVVTIGRETDFDIDPLGWFPEVDKRVYSSIELRDVVLGFLSSSNGDCRRVRSWADLYRNYCLSELSEQTIRAFWEPPNGMSPACWATKATSVSSSA